MYSVDRITMSIFFFNFTYLFCIMKRGLILFFKTHLQDFQETFVRWILTSVPAPHARMVRNVQMVPTSTLVNVLKVHIYAVFSDVECSHFCPSTYKCDNAFNLFSYPPGYTGQHCEIDINECYSDPCHYGTCKDGLASFTCYCRPGYTGRLCETNINECLSQPCKNGGTCQDRENSYVCSCPKGTAGETSLQLIFR